MSREPDRTGATTGPYTLVEAELFHELFGRWPQSRVPAARYLDPGIGQEISDQVESAGVRSIPAGHPLRPLVEAAIRAGYPANRT